MVDGFRPLRLGTIMKFGCLEFMSLGSGYDMVLLPPRDNVEPRLEPIPPQPVRGRRLSTKAGRQSTLGYTHGSSLSVDGAQATNLMVTQDTDKVFIQVRPPCDRNTYVLRLIVLDCVERIIVS